MNPRPWVLAIFLASCSTVSKDEMILVRGVQNSELLPQSTPSRYCDAVRCADIELTTDETGRILHFTLRTRHFPVREVNLATALPQDCRVTALDSIGYGEVEVTGRRVYDFMNIYTPTFLIAPTPSCPYTSVLVDIDQHQADVIPENDN